MIRWSAVAGLSLLWLMMWGDVTALLVVSGVLVAVGVVVIFPFPSAKWAGTVRPWRFVILVTRFIADLVAASIQVAWLAIRPAPLGKGAVIEVQLHTRSELLLVITGELVSLVPGTLLVEIDPVGSRMWLHVLDGTQDLARVEAAAQAQERRVIAALGSREEFRAHVKNEEEVEP